MSNNRKEEIVFTTLELAAQKGLASVSMSMIADKIGISLRFINILNPRTRSWRRCISFSGSRQKKKQI